MDSEHHIVVMIPKSMVSITQQVKFVVELEQNEPVLRQQHRRGNTNDYDVPAHHQNARDQGWNQEPRPQYRTVVREPYMYTNNVQEHRLQPVTPPTRMTSDGANQSIRAHSAAVVQDPKRPCIRLSPQFGTVALPASPPSAMTSSMTSTSNETKIRSFDFSPHEMDLIITSLETGVSYREVHRMFPQLALATFKTRYYRIKADLTNSGRLQATSNTD